jgi:kynurenine formamidase
MSHEITAGMITYPGVAAPRLEVVTSRAASAARLGPGVSLEIESLTLAGNTGTYLDSPFHFHADRADLSRLPLERLVNVPVAVVRAVGQTAVTAADLGDPGRLWGKAVLVHTNWARHWGTPRYLDPDCPHLTADAIDALVAANIALAGIDSLNIDDPADPARPPGASAPAGGGHPHRRAPHRSRLRARRRRPADRTAGAGARHGVVSRPRGGRRRRLVPVSEPRVGRAGRR